MKVELKNILYMLVTVTTCFGTVLPFSDILAHSVYGCQ